MKIKDKSIDTVLYIKYYQILSLLMLSVVKVENLKTLVANILIFVSPH